MSCCHSDYEHCSTCGRNGCYYFGDEVQIRRSRYSRLTRNELLEAVLEWIEAYPQDRFERSDLPNGIRQDERSAHALKWLTHLGILEKINVRRSPNVWKVKNPPSVWRIRNG